MNYMSVATGISAETLAWSPLGWSPVSFAQFDPDHKYKGGPDFASAVLAHHYPQVVNHGDMTKFSEWPDARVDVLAGGTPCQTFSVAGLGAGLDDPRGDLSLVYAAIARRYRPAWVVWENTNGVLSNDKGRAFASILGLLSGQRIEVPSSGWRTGGVVPGIERAYGLAWRVLDTQHVRIHGFGRALPQRRRRVFVVGYLGDWRRAAAVLFEREGLSGNPPPSRRSAQDVAGAITRSFGVRGGVDEGERGTLVAGTLTARSSRSRGAGCVDDAALIPEVANPLTARIHKGVNTTMDEGQTMIPHPAEVAPPLLAGDNSTGGDRQLGMDIDSVHSLIPISFNARQDPDSSEGIAGPVSTYATDQAVAFQDRFRGDDGRGYSRPPPATEEVCGTLETVKPWSIARGWTVRRLMPIECERLQGVPDNFTLIPYRGKLAADGPRYKVLGNMQSINVMRWLGTRIKMVSEIE